MVTHRPLAIVALDLSTDAIEQAADLDAISAFMWKEIEGWNAALSTAPEDSQDSDPGEDVAA